MANPNSQDDLIRAASSMSLDELMTTAEIETGHRIQRRELLRMALYKFTKAFITLEGNRDRLLNAKIRVAFLGSAGVVHPKAEVTLPGD